MLELLGMVETVPWAMASKKPDDLTLKKTRPAHRAHHSATEDFERQLRSFMGQRRFLG